jgi:hypothetical protein
MSALVSFRDTPATIEKQSRLKLRTVRQVGQRLPKREEFEERA